MAKYIYIKLQAKTRKLIILKGRGSQKDLTAAKKVAAEAADKAVERYLMEKNLI